MRTIFLFMNVSLDGFFEAPGHDISGFKNDFEAFSGDGSKVVDTLLMGRKTYEMMKFWATPQALEMAPAVAKFMNATPKFVASHSDFVPEWENVTVISKDVLAEVRKLKEQPGKDIGIFGSNHLCVSLMAEGLIDEFQIVLNPVAFGAGTTLFEGLPAKVNFTLTSSRQFKSGAVLLTYKPE